MKLVIGGYSQGKLNYILQKDYNNGCIVLDAVLPEEKQIQEMHLQGKTIIINHFHQWVREQLLQENSPEENIEVFLKQDSDCIIISDEIGNGIVPIDSFEREYRERTGRILVSLASRADEVVRVICGIGQKIK